MYLCQDHRHIYISQNNSISKSMLLYVKNLWKMLIIISQSPKWHLQFASNQESQDKQLVSYYHKWLKKSKKSGRLRSWSQQMFDIIAWVTTEAIHSLSKQMAISFLSIDLPFYCSSYFADVW